MAEHNGARKPHEYIVYPEFNGLEKYVWEGLNQIGRPISHITKTRKNVKGENKPIWHDKPSLDEFVARSLGLNMDEYGKDKSSNPLYKAIANEIRVLRKKGILIDWRRTSIRNKGVGVWRLDKTKLEKFVENRVKYEMKKENFHSTGLPGMMIVRQKQMEFRNYLLKEYRKCVFCGFELKEYMIGAHIVPYSIMRITDAENSMNPTNGLLLCRLCDVAFEHGSITVADDFGIEVEDHLIEQRAPTIKSWIAHIRPEIRIGVDARYPPDPRYLRRKRELLGYKAGA